MTFVPREGRAPALAALLALTFSGCSVAGYPGGLAGPPPAAAAPAPVPIPEPAPEPPPPEPAEPAPLPSPPAQAEPRTYEVLGQSYTTLGTSEGYRETGVASWYGEKFHGRRTASGRVFDMYAMTAAHRTLPFPTCVAVRRLDDERTVHVRVIDRGPFDDDQRRIIDVSYAAAVELGLVGPGTAEVEVSAVDAATC